MPVHKTIKTAVFAGTGRLGVPVAKSLLDRKYMTVISYRTGRNSEKTVDMLLESYPSQVIGIEADLCNISDAHKIAEITTEKFRQIDALLIFASGYPDEQADWKRWQGGGKITQDDWKYYDSNFILTRNIITAFEKSKIKNQKSKTKPQAVITFGDARSLPYMDWDILDPYESIGGIIKASLNDIAQLGLKRLSKLTPQRHINPYTLAKIDIAYLTRKLAVQNREIRFNCISPGPMLPPVDFTGEQNNAVLKTTLMKKWGGCEPIVQAVNYLLNADFVTGQILTVDGGQFLHEKFSSVKKPNPDS